VCLPLSAAALPVLSVLLVLLCIRCSSSLSLSRIAVAVPRALSHRPRFSWCTCSSGALRSSSSCSSSLLGLAAVASPQSAESSPRALVNEGMNLFRQGDVDGSIALFDQAERQAPGIRPYLWQRGLSYYYADRFQEGSDQFRYDVTVNPLDVEEIVWDIACQCRLRPDIIPPRNKMSLPAGKSDRRRIMGTVYSLFRRDGATEHDLAVKGQTGSESDEFYSLFYLGLYCESRGETGKAEAYMKASASSAYGTGSGDYMAACAKVHCKLRGWV